MNTNYRSIPLISRGDSVVIVMAVALLLSVFITLWQPEGHGAEAVVYLNGKRWARLNLFENKDIQVPGPLGISRLQVRNGQIRFVDSPCPTKLCVHAGWLSQGGETATCLPNRVSIQVLGDDPRYDTINF
jgi:hypothetical protein